eukprot:gene22235-26813_t
MAAMPGVTFLMNMIMLFVTLGVNDCPGTSPMGGCVGEASLGSCAFESPRVNPFYGPRADTLITLGAKDTPKILDLELWRFISAVYLHAGVLHLLGNMVGLLVYGVQLERSFGGLRLAVVWFVSGFFSMLCSAVFLPNIVSVGASGAVCGLMGCSLGEVMLNWRS